MSRERIPFNYEEYLTGQYEVTNEEEWKILEITKFTNPNIHQPIIVITIGEDGETLDLAEFNVNGNYRIDDSKSAYDLFMYGKPKILYVNIYKYKDREYFSHTFENKELSVIYRNSVRSQEVVFIKTIEVEIEE